MNHRCPRLPGCPAAGPTVCCIYHHINASPFFTIRKTHYIVKLVPLLCLRWPAGGEVFINSSCPPAPTPNPGPPLSASRCSWWEDFLHKLHSTSQRANTCWRLHSESKTASRSDFLSLVGLLFCSFMHIESDPKLARKGQHGCNLCFGVSSPLLSPLPSSQLPPPRPSGHGCLLWRGGHPEPLHAQVWEHRLQSHRGGIERVRLPAWGILHADGVNALLPPVRRSGPGAQSQRPPPDGLPQEWGEHLVAEPIHVFWHPAPEFCKPHPAPR